MPLNLEIHFQVTVLHKKAPPTLVDDCIDKFRQHEVDRKRLRLLSGQRGSTESAPVDFLIGGEGDPLSSSLNENYDVTENHRVEDLTRGGGKNLVQNGARNYWY